MRKVDGSASSVAVGRHNRIVAVGGQGSFFKITRTLPDGHIDKHFGHRGVATVRFGSNATHQRPTSVAIGRKGGVVVAGSVCSASWICRFGVARLRRNGDLDRRFGDHGRVEIDFQGLQASYIRGPSVAFRGGGRIVLAGSAGDSRTANEWKIGLAALRSNGSLDPRFGDGGEVVSSFAPAGDHCKRHSGFVKGMALDSHERIVVTGECMHDSRAAVARFRRNGKLDRSFSGNGLVNRKLGIFQVEALAIDKRDRIDIMGDRGRAFALARLRAGGKLDRSFGRHGRAKVTWGSGRSAGVRSGAVDSRGRIVVGGSRSSRFAFARFKRNGHVDRRFGRRGRAVVSDPRRGYGLNATGTMAIDRRDRIIGSGVETHRVTGNRHLALVRVLG